MAIATDRDPADSTVYFNVAVSSGFVYAGVHVPSLLLIPASSTLFCVYRDLYLPKTVLLVVPVIRLLPVTCVPPTSEMCAHIPESYSVK